MFFVFLKLFLNDMAATCAKWNSQQVTHMQNQTHRQESGAKDLFKKQKILQGLISKKKNYQGPKPKCAIFAGTKIIFKPTKKLLRD